MIVFWLRSGIAGIVILPFLVFYPVAAFIVWLTSAITHPSVTPAKAGAH
jgi:hypothetical protein